MPIPTTHPLLEGMRAAAAEQWSGSIQVTHAGKPFGQVVFVGGKVAWAISVVQGEKLGNFLWRLGYLTQSQLDVVNAIFQAHEGTKRLGAILEECGFLTRPVLRRGLLLHTRAAVLSVLKSAFAELTRVPGIFGLGEEVVFELDEILPAELSGAGWREDEISQVTSWKFWKMNNAENEVLRPLQVDDYLGSGIFAADGAILTAHAVAGKGDPLLAGVFLATIMDGAARAAATTQLDAVTSMVMECVDIWVVARWVGPERRHILATVLDREGNAGAARVAMQRAMPKIEEWVQRYAHPDRFQHLVKAMLEDAKTPEETVRAVKIAIREQLRRQRRKHAPAKTLRPLREALALLDQKKVGDALRLLEGMPV